MYNNIGISTIKGKGTTGYIQSNRINFQTERRKERVGSEYYSKKPKKEKYEDETLIEHELLRRIEINIREFIEKQFQSNSIEEKKLKLQQKRKEINELIQNKFNEEKEYQKKLNKNKTKFNEKKIKLNILKEISFQEIK